MNSLIQDSLNPGYEKRLKKLELNIHYSRFDLIFFWLIVTIFSLIMLPNLELLAQETKPETVHFIDGSIVSGTIIEINREIIRIRQPDGKIIKRSVREIHRFSSGRSFKEIYRQAVDSETIKPQQKDIAVETFKTETALATQDKPQIMPKHRFEIAPTFFYHKYEESPIAIDGHMYGINWKYEYNNEMLMFKLDFDYALGNLDYDGQTWSGMPVTAGTDDNLLDLRALIGGNIQNGDYTVTPFVGFGIRYWNNDIKSPGGYEREITYYYSPVGLRVYSKLLQTWFWEINAEYDLFWGGKVKSHLSDAIPGANDPENNQPFGDGHGMRISIKLSNNFHKNYSWFVEPFFKYWKVSDSELDILTVSGVPVAAVYEPENETKIWGVLVGIGF